MGFVRRFMYVFGPISSLFDFLSFLVLFFVLKATAPVFQTAWFMESLATQTLVIHVIRTKHSPLKSIASIQLLFSSILCVAAGWALPYTPLGRLFRFEPLPLYLLLILAGIVLCYLVVVEITKRVFYSRVDF